MPIKVGSQLGATERAGMDPSINRARGRNTPRRGHQGPKREVKLVQVVSGTSARKPDVNFAPTAAQHLMTAGVLTTRRKSRISGITAAPFPAAKPL